MISMLNWMLIFITVRFAYPQATVVTSRSNCTEVAIEQQLMHAYLGWPFTIRCNLIIETLEFDFYDLLYEDDVTEYSEVTCQIRDVHNGNFLLNVSTDYETLLYDGGDIEHIIIPDLKPGDNLDYDIIVHIPDSLDNCYWGRIHLNLTQFHQETCREYLAGRTPTLPIASVSTIKQFSCSIETEIFPKLHEPLGGMYGFNSTWLRNCSSLPGNVTITPDRTLRIEPVDFDHAGIYTCAVTYNGMTRYIASYAVCVAHPHKINQHSITCRDKVVKTNVGEEAEFVCVGIFGEGVIRESSFRVLWQKFYANGTEETKKNICQSQFSDDRISCEFNYESRCFLEVASHADRVVPTAEIVIKLRVKNVNEFDFGNYVIFLKSNLQHSSVENETISLQWNAVPPTLAKAAIAGISIGVVCVVIIIAIIILYNLIYVRVYFKRKFGTYETDDRRYGALLSYHFSQELDQFAKKQVGESSRMVREVLERLGYRVYDEKREGSSGQNQAQNIRNNIENSHRIVIILTLKYIQDGWSMRGLQEGFDEMIKSRSKIIFVLVPGIKEYLKQHSINDDTCRMIKRAIKLNYVIDWSNEERFNSKLFKLKFEDSMPKLSSQRPSRLLSTSSNGNTGSYGNGGFQRCFSTDTEVSMTEIDIPRTDGEVLEIIREQPQDSNNTSV